MGLLGSRSRRGGSDLVALRGIVPELQAENEDVLACRAGNQKIRMDSLLKLCSKRMKRDVVESQIKCWHSNWRMFAQR